ncbi:thioesterase family protein [Brevibacillus sp. TJ4]|uniref:thioesterase family protein n=1 Tax=Brevibacillus sp. TJ4 TaxID=3234853 RepID=UPI0037CE99E5
MKEGLQPGVCAEFEVSVTPEMYPVFEGNMIHPVMSTVSMIYYMELAGRKVILPYLEDHEEGCGFAVDIKHVGPAVSGQTVRFRAVCREVTDKRVVCEVTADTAQNRVGLGTFTQAIFHKEEARRKFAAQAE